MFSTSFLKRWFQGSRKPAARSRTRPKVKPAFEGLEERWCPALAVDVYDLNGLGNAPTSAVQIGKAAPDNDLFFAQSGLTIDSANDVDHYGIHIDGTGAGDSYFKIVFTNADGDLDLELYKLNNDGTTTQVGSSKSVNDVEMVSLVGKSGNYVVKVLGFQGAANQYMVGLNIQADGPVIPDNTFPTINPVGPNGQVSNLRPQITWDATFGGDYFDVWLDDLTAGTSNILPGTTTVDTFYTPEVDLVSGHDYRVWARGHTIGGNIWAWSAPRDFHVNGVTFDQFSGPITDLYPNITWTGVQGAAKYSVWVDDVTTGQSNIFPGEEGTANGWQLSTGNTSKYCIPGHQYHIYVKAANAQGQGNWGDGMLFTVGNLQFAKPQTALNDLDPPIPFTRVAHSSVTTFWLNDLTTGQQDLFPNQQQAGNSWIVPSNLTLGHNYRLWAKTFGPGANNPTGWWSDPIDFSINTSVNAMAPAQSLRPFIMWNKFTGVSNWEVWLQDKAGGANLTPGLIVNGISWSPNFDLISGHSYEVWVRAQGGAWSAKQTFQVDTVNEFHLGKDVNSNREVTWTPLDKVTSYELYVTDLTTGVGNLFPGMTFNQPAVVKFLGSHWKLPAGMDITHTYRLWIKAKNANGLGEWSQPFDFTPNKV